MFARRLILVLAVLATTSSFSRADTATITGVSQIYLRSGPGTTYSPNGVLSSGEAVTTLDLVGNWQRVQTNDGRTGFVYTGYLSFGDAPAAEARPAAAGTFAAAPPAVAPAPAAPPPAVAMAGENPEPAAGAGEIEMWQAELASLKAEVARLRSEVGPGAEDETSAAALTLPTRGPVEISPSPSDTTNLRTVGVAVFFLVVGWVFGAGFARRRNRSQRGRLRF